MPKPVCVKCHCFYRPKKNGFFITEAMPKYSPGAPNENIRGLRAPEAWEPYKLWVGDKWQCPDCGHEIVVGFASNPVSEHYLPDFDEKAKLYNPNDFRVNDC